MEYIKSIEPGTNVTLILQASVDKDYFGSNISLKQNNEKNGFMSPIRKIKNKLCHSDDKKSSIRTNSSQELNKIDKDGTYVAANIRPRNSSQPSVERNLIDRCIINDVLNKYTNSSALPNGNLEKIEFLVF